MIHRDNFGQISMRKWREHQCSQASIRIFTIFYQLNLFLKFQTIKTKK